MTNVEAAECLVAVLRERGSVGPVNEAQVAAVLTLAAAVDRDPDNASLWREYRAVEEALRDLARSETDEFGRLLEEFRRAEVGDVEDAKP